jgi:hypothetical protein
MPEAIGKLNKKYWIVRQPREEWRWVLAVEFIPPARTPRGITLIAHIFDDMFVPDKQGYYKVPSMKLHETE